jgi:hypothetical protein
MVLRMRPKLPQGSFTFFICVSLILGSSLGCTRFAELVKQSRGEEPTTEYPIDNSDGGGADNSLIKKSNFYITECFNKYSNRVVDSFNRYSSWVKDMEAGPTGKEQNIYGLYDLNGDGSDCANAVASAKQLDPDLPDIEDAADKYVVSLKEVASQIKGVYNYYEQEDYKDDNFAKGKAAHAALVAAFKDFKSVNDNFSAAVDKLEDQVAEQELAKLKSGSGQQQYQYFVVESGIKAKKLKSLLQSKGYEEITADEMSPLIADFETTIESLRTAPDAKKTSSDSYAKSCDDFAKASKEMMRRIRDGKKFSDTEQRQIAMGAGWMVEGSPAKVIKAYNDMIMQRRFTRF